MKQANKLVGRTVMLASAIIVARITLAEGSEASFVMQTLHEFHHGPHTPIGSLLEDSDGSFYGVAEGGGALGGGAIYRLTREGALTTLISFDSTTGVSSRIIKGSDGNLYGITWGGTFFKFATGSALTILTRFYGINGGHPSSLIQGVDGNFYGITQGGEERPGRGTVFKVTPRGSLTTIVSFTNKDLTNPDCLAQHGDGSFYGITRGGGIGGAGTVFKLTPDGILSTIVSFNGSNGRAPDSFMQGSDGNFYGTTISGGPGGYGTIFKVTPSGIFNTLASFDGANGRWPSGLVQGKDGIIYGAKLKGGTDGFAVFKITPDGTVTTLVSLDFAGAWRPPWLTLGSDGSLYGTEIDGEDDPNRQGSVFKVTPDGQFSVLALFSSDGGYSPSGLVAGTNGNFYGTTRAGGVNTAGTVFKMSPDGIFTTLASFNDPNSAQRPWSLIQGSDGNFYACAGGPLTAATVFKMTPDGTLTRFVELPKTGGFSFNSVFSLNGLIQGSDSNLYGITPSGGTHRLGSIFTITLEGVLTTMHSFDGTNGINPYLLIQGSDGNFYGAARFNENSSVMFKMTPTGTITSLVAFTSRIRGYASSLIQGGDGNLYGTASGGSIFRMSRDGMLTMVGMVNGGSFPYSLIQGSDGHFYGATRKSRADRIYENDGTIFKITRDGTLTTLVSFTGELGGASGSLFLNRPCLIEGRDGRLYGINSDGEGAIFRLVEPPVLSTTRQPDGRVALSWNSFPGDTYRVESKPTLTDTNWVVLTPAVTATGSTASVTDTSGSASERYYRIRLLP